MADVLSQSEIDNLLKALNSGEIDVDEIYKNLESDKYSVYLNDNDTDGGAD